MFGRIDRYLLSQLLTLFGFFALVLVMVYWVNQAVRLFDQLIADGQNLSVFLVLTALTLPNVIRLVVPTASFAATLYVINRMSSESELTVAQATGFSPLRLAWPVMAFGLFSALAMGTLTHLVVPLSLAQLEDREAEISENVTARLLQEGVFQHPAPGMTFYLRDITGEGELLDVFLADTREEDQQLIYTAKRAFLVRSDDGPKLAMIDGMVQSLNLETMLLTTTKFNDFVTDLAQFSFETQEAILNARELTTPQLLSPDLRAAQNVTEGQAWTEIHERSANALSAITFTIVGFAVMMTGSFSRFGVLPRIISAIVVLVILQGAYGVAGDQAVSQPAQWYLWYLPFAAAIVFALLFLWWRSAPWTARAAKAAAS